MSHFNNWDTKAHWDVPESTRIITLSDIHGDLEALLICLRDCAHVIRRKERMHECIPDCTKTSCAGECAGPDEQVWAYLAEDCSRDPLSVPDFGYEWVDGDETMVVIVGDLIDPVRRNLATYALLTYSEFGPEDVYYPQVELKILWFINALNENSRTRARSAQFGRIFKLCGNHELLNFDPQKSRDRFICYSLTNADSCRTGNLYHGNETRLECFKFGNYGYRLYQETTGMHVVLRINHNLFIHGQLPRLHPSRGSYTTLTQYDRVNEFLQRREFDEIRQDEYIEHLNGVLDGVQTRDWGELDSTGRVSSHAPFCHDVQTQIEQFVDYPIGYTKGQIRVFIGHCQQHRSSHTQGAERHTLRTLESRNGQIETYRNDSEFFGVANIHEQDSNQTFGITTECLLDSSTAGNYQPQLIKVDVAMGRGQDVLDKKRMQDKGYFLPRMPQVFESRGNQLRIIRPTLLFMRMHFRRLNVSRWFEHNVRLKQETLAFINQHKKVIDSYESMLLVYNNLKKEYAATRQVNQQMQRVIDMEYEDMENYYDDHELILDEYYRLKDDTVNVSPDFLYAPRYTSSGTMYGTKSKCRRSTKSKCRRTKRRGKSKRRLRTKCKRRGAKHLRTKCKRRT